MTQLDRQRKHDERWQHEVLSALARMMDVLHDISDAVQAIAEAQRRPTSSPPVTLDGPELLSIEALAERIGVSPGTVRSRRATGDGPVATTIGRRIFFHRDDVAAWLAEKREPDQPQTRPWRETFVPGRIGSGVPASSAPREVLWCAGSHSEPKAASRYTGRAICRACGDDVLVNSDGRLRKHRAHNW